MKRNIIYIALLLIATTNAMSQTATPLLIGDPVPDIAFNKMLNHTASRGKLSDFKGKAIIIDMWFRECGACIDAMPHLDTLRREFKDDLQVILVTWQNEQRIKEFWEENKSVGKIDFVQSVGDSSIRKYFPAVYYPHQIWIGKDGIIKSINDGTKTTRPNLRKLINNELLSIPIKEDEPNAIVRQGLEPLISSYFEQNKSKIIHYSYLSTYRKEFGAIEGQEYDKKNGVWRYRNLNEFFPRLYHIAYDGNNGSVFDYRNRVVRMDTNPLKTEPDYTEHSNFFSYDLIVRDTSATNIRAIMIQDLDRSLGFKSREEIRKIQSYVIRPNGKGTRYRNALEPDKKRYVANIKLEQNKDLIFNRKSILIGLETLFYNCDKPIYFENLLTDQINLKVKWNTKDLAAMNRELKNFDLEIVLENRDTKVIILTDPN